MTAPRIVIRFVRRLASWEDERPLEELQRLEFRNRDGSPDLKPSVYLVSDEEQVLTQVYAEHCATPPIGLDTRASCIDTQGCADRLLDTDGSARFTFARDAHREYDIEDPVSLLGFVGRLRERVRMRQVRTITKAQVLTYARARVAAGDPEWVAVAQLGEKDWLLALQKLILQPATE